MSHVNPYYLLGSYSREKLCCPENMDGALKKETCYLCAFISFFQLS
jgi:hypothetical protein